MVSERVELSPLFHACIASISHSRLHFLCMDSTRGHARFPAEKESDILDFGKIDLSFTATNMEAKQAFMVVVRSTSQGEVNAHLTAG